MWKLYDLKKEVKLKVLHTDQNKLNSKLKLQSQFALSEISDPELFLTIHSQ